ncbi:hypothetical protein VP01_1536g1 [Puccinia sorghi]|uniref:Uncharacterized protein n=1 Tax=Puccinia sorghi TaxID=27349 RepID=A0A0L6VIG1_9BASI|nr:hypothetical protein VP01_1536g1 [Puccinia sorghi]
MTLIFLFYDHIENGDALLKLNKTNKTLPNNKNWVSNKTFAYFLITLFSSAAWISTNLTVRFMILLHQWLMDLSNTHLQPHTLELGRPTKHTPQANPLFFLLGRCATPASTLSQACLQIWQGSCVKSFPFWNLVTITYGCMSGEKEELQPSAQQSKCDCMIPKGFFYLHRGFYMLSTWHQANSPKIRLNFCTTDNQHKTGIRSLYDQVKRNNLHSSAMETALVDGMEFLLADENKDFLNTTEKSSQFTQRRFFFLNLGESQGPHWGSYVGGPPAKLHLIALCNPSCSVDSLRNQLLFYLVYLMFLRILKNKELSILTAIFSRRHFSLIFFLSKGKIKPPPSGKLLSLIPFCQNLKYLIWQRLCSDKSLLNNQWNVHDQREEKKSDMNKGKRSLMTTPVSALLPNFWTPQTTQPDPAPFMLQSSFNSLFHNNLAIVFRLFKCVLKENKKIIKNSLQWHLSPTDRAAGTSQTIVCFFIIYNSTVTLPKLNKKKVLCCIF